MIRIGLEMLIDRGIITILSDVKKSGMLIVPEDNCWQSTHTNHSTPIQTRAIGTQNDKETAQPTIEKITAYFIIPPHQEDHDCFILPKKVRINWTQKNAANHIQ